MKQNASTGAQSEAPRRNWRPGQEQHPGQENRRKPKGDGGKGTGKNMSRQFATNVTTIYDISLRLLNALNSEDRGLKVRFSLAMIVFETVELILCQMLSSQGRNAPSDPYPHYLVRLAASRFYDNLRHFMTISVSFFH